MRIRIVDTCEPNTVTADRGSDSPSPRSRRRRASCLEFERIEPGTDASTRSGTDGTTMKDKSCPNAWSASEDSARRIEWEQFWNVVIDLAIDQSTPHPDE